MRAPFVGIIILTLALCSCSSIPPEEPVEEPVATTTPVITDTPNDDPQVRALEAQILDMRREMDMLRITIINLRAELVAKQPQNPDTVKNPPATGRLQQLADVVAKQSDVHRVWMGQFNQVSVVLYPMTKPEYVDPINKQLGAEYCYMVFVAVNNNPKNIWTYKPKKGFVVAQFDKKAGVQGSSYIQCRDPISLIEREEQKVNGTMREARERFEARELRQGEQIDTVVIFEKGTDFSKITKLFLGDLVVPEVELPKVK